jgi:phytoene dehydrogenase-like protein
MNQRDSGTYDAVVVGAGTNGLAAAIRLAQAGLSTLVVERNLEVGGSARSGYLTLPGFLHDICSAVHPLAAASPFLDSLRLQRYGLEFIQPGLPMAHPIAKDLTVAMHLSVRETAANLGADANSYRRLFEPLVSRRRSLTSEFLRPILHLPRDPYAWARFAWAALKPASYVAKRHFSGEPARALLAGLAAHSTLPLEATGSAAFALVLGMLAHTVGWPIPRGGAQAISNALADYLQALGGKIETDVLVTRLEDLPRARVILLDLTPHQFLQIAGDKLPSRYRHRLRRFRYGPAVFKVDYALRDPIPWSSEICRRAGTVHLGGTFREIAAAERAVANGRHPEQPFVLLAQPTLFDPTRAPAGCHIAWAYCHLPNSSTCDMTNRIEAQIERFAPGFRDCVLSRHVMQPADLEKGNPNLVGGSINGGANNLAQLIARPILGRNPYRTPLSGVYLCSSSTPPGAGVHGMCGFHAATTALQDVLRGRGSSARGAAQ